MTKKELEIENSTLKVKIEFMKLRIDELDRERRQAWRHYYVLKSISIPKKCPACDGLLIERVNSNGGYFPACSNWPSCEYKVEERKKKQKKDLNAYQLK